LNTGKELLLNEIDEAGGLSVTPGTETYIKMNTLTRGTTMKTIKCASLVLALAFVVVLTPIVIGAEPIKIGVFGPMTGTMSIGGIRQKEGSQFAADEINAAGGLLGRKLQMIYEDTEGVPQNAVNIMNKFYYRDRVTATMGSNNSPEVLAVLDLILRGETPHIVPSGVAYAITHSGNPWVFRVVPTDELFTKALVEYAVKVLKFKRIAIVHDTNDYGQAGMRMVTENLKGNGLAPVLVAGYNTGTKDFSPQLLKAREAKAEGIIIWGNYTEGAQLVRQVKELGITSKVLVSTGVTIGNFYELAGDAANGIIGVSPGFSLESKEQHVQEFIQKYEAKMGYKPDLNVVMGYDAVHLFAKAVADAKSTDKAVIREALSRVKDLQLISGKITINSNGDGGTKTLIYIVENGRPRLVQ